MKKFSYKVVDTPDNGASHLEDFLNVEGKDGWELILIDHYYDYYDTKYITLTLKKELDND